ncbi:MAG: transcription antitermination factor NusB [Bacillota bacterium]|nr:transcription antitermination factor NusB [Bacillota bacterium]
MEAIFEKDEYLYPDEDTSRNKLQRVALFAIYDALTYLDMNEAIDVEGIVSSLFNKPYEECDYFVKAALILSIKHLEEIEKVFDEVLDKWSFSRRNRVEQAIYLLAYVHYFYIDEKVDKGVVIDIALRQCKEYVNTKNNEHKRVNAVLDKVLHR